METASLFRAIKPLTKSIPTRSYSAPSLPKYRSGQEGKLKRVYDGLLLDAGGTLLQLAKPVEETYLTIGRKYGLQCTVADIKHGFRRAFSAPWPERLRYQGDGRPFWKLVVSEATGCDDAKYFEEVYEYYANGDAWHLPEGAHETMLSLKDAGDQISVEASKAVHVGDDKKADKAGANAVGIECWLWGSDVKNFSDIQDRVLPSKPLN